MKKLTVSLAVSTTLLASQAFAFAFDTYGSCSGCNPFKLAQVQPGLANEAAAFIASGGAMEISPELEQAMATVAAVNPEATDIEMARAVIAATATEQQ